MTRLNGIPSIGSVKLRPKRGRARVAFCDCKLVCYNISRNPNLPKFGDASERIPLTDGIADWGQGGGERDALELTPCHKSQLSTCPFSSGTSPEPNWKAA